MLSLSSSSTKHSRCVCLAAVALGSCLLTITIITITLAFLHQQSLFVLLTPSTPFIYDQFYNISSPRATGCGTSIVEAKASGCIFDELSDLWLPPQCSRAFEQEYLTTNHGGPPVYFVKPDGEERISDRSQYAGGPIYYSTTRDHLLHCEYNLYRFAESLKTGARVGHAGDFASHMKHCARMLGQFANMAPGIDKVDVDTISTFGFC